MSQQAINRNTLASKPTTTGEVVVGVRVDTLPQSEADRLAAAGTFYPLTVDANGNLRVVLSDQQTTTTTASNDEVAKLLGEIRDLLEEQRDLLLKIA